MTATSSRLLTLAVLAVLMAASRGHAFDHFSPPDASWAVFFIAGFHLRGWGRWAFPLLMALAVAVDWWVIRSQGIDFWNHYCVSPGYWFLLPAYGAMWLGGSWLRRHYRGASWEALGRLAGAFLVAPASETAKRAIPGMGPDFIEHRREKLPFPSVLIASATDPYCTQDEARELAEAWGSEFVDAGDSGHLNSESGHGPWPDGLLRFAGFLKSLSAVPQRLSQ